MRRRLFTQEQIKEALRLKQQGYSKRRLAEYFNVGGTTVWDNIYTLSRTRGNKSRQTSFKDIKTFLIIVTEHRIQGLTSQEVAERFEVPLKDMNIIWCRTL